MNTDVVILLVWYFGFVLPLIIWAFVEDDKPKYKTPKDLVRAKSARAWLKMNADYIRGK